MAPRSRYTEPSIAPPALALQVPEVAAPAPDAWWRALRDPQLDRLVSDVLNHNADLKAAAIEVAQADIETKLAVINPRFSLGYSHDSGGLIHGQPRTPAHALTATADYEIDWWGKLDAASDIAKWNAKAAKLYRERAASVVAARAVNNYFQIAALNERISISEQSVAYARRTVELVDVLVRAGNAAPLERAEAAQHLEQQLANHARLNQLRQEARSVRAVLLAGAPSTSSGERGQMPEIELPPVPGGLPASVLRHRADLGAEEAQLRATLARADATKLSFYPQLSLTASLGTASRQLGDLLRSPAGAVATILSAPFLQFNEAKFASQLARAQYEEARVLFQQKLLRALHEVNDALSARAQLSEEANRQRAALKAAQAAERIYEVRYESGGSPLRFWLDAQESRRQAQVALLSVELEQLENYSTLCVALGGRAQEG